MVVWTADTPVDWTLLGLALVFAGVGYCLIRDAWEVW